MENYQPSRCPIAQEWLALDKFERVQLVREYHEDANEPLPEDTIELHASIHVVVENQIAKVFVPVPQRLTGSGARILLCGETQKL